MSEANLQSPLEQTGKPKRKKWKRVAIVFQFLLLIFCFGGWETLCFRNLPLFLFLLFIFSIIFGIGVHTDRKYQGKRFKGAFANMGYILLFLTILMFVMYFYVPVTRISKETTYLTEPRTPDGLAIDIRRAIAEKYLPDCSPHENGFRHVVEKLGFDAVMTAVEENQKDAVKEKLYHALDLDLNIGAELKFESLHKYFDRIFKQFSEKDRTEGKNKEEIKELRDADWEIVRQFSQLPWPEQYRDLMEQWFADNAAALDCFGDAVRQKEYFVPYFQDSVSFKVMELYEHCTYFHEEMTHALTLRILHVIMQNDQEKMLHDIDTLARLVKKQNDHIQCSWNMAIHQNSLRQSMLNVIQYGEPDQALLEKLQAIHDDNQGQFSLADLVFLTRMEGMHFFYYIGSGKIFSIYDEKDPPSAMETVPKAPLFVMKMLNAGVKYFGWTPAFQRYNLQMNELDELADQPFSRKLLDELTRYQENNRETLDHIDGIAPIVSFFLRKGYIQIFPEFMVDVAIRFDSLQEHLYRALFQDIAGQRQMEIALALERYALDHDGEYPETLEPLRDGYLLELPLDPFTDGEPFHYKPRQSESEKGYILYSVGMNGVDDGGLNGTKCDPETEEQPQGDDPNTEIMKKIS